MASRRVFIAIDVSEEARAAAFEHIQRLRQNAADVRISWEKHEKLHLTIKFLGPTEDAVLLKFTEALAVAAAQTEAFTAELSGSGVFPNTRLPRILWLGVTTGSEAMKALAISVEDACSVFGFEREKRRFSPHLTIARIREPANGRRLAERHVQTGFAPVRFDVRELVVYESKLSPAGSTYTALYRHPFSVCK